MEITKEQREISHCLLTKAGEFFGHNPNIGLALEAINRKPGPMTARVADFYNLTDRLNLNYFSQLSAVNRLKRSFSPYIPSLSQLKTRDLGPVFENIRDRIDKNDLDLIPYANNPYGIGSRLLIEGYGATLEKASGKPGLTRTAVLAVKEAMFHTLAGASILNDVLGEMIETRDDFAGNTKNSLETLAQLPRTAKEQFAIFKEETREERETAAKKLHDEVQMAFEKAAAAFPGYFQQKPFSILASAYRGKLPGSIDRKLSRLPQNSPIYDLYACKFALPDKDQVNWAIRVIQYNFPTPPVLFGAYRPLKEVGNNPWQFKGERSHPEYEGVIMRVIFDWNGRKEVGEVQLYTPEQWKKEEETRDYYHT